MQAGFCLQHHLHRTAHCLHATTATRSCVPQAQACTDAEPFKRDMERAFSALRVAEASGDWRGTPYGSNTDALAAALETVRRHGVTLPGGVCSVMVTTLILEGWSSQLDPGHSVLNQVRKHAECCSFGRVRGCLQT